MAKKGETRRKVLDRINSGENTNTKILLALGWKVKGKKSDMRTLLNYHIGKLKKAGLITVVDGHYVVLVDPDKIADKKRLEELINKIKTPTRNVRKEVINDLIVFAKNWTVTDTTTWTFLIDAMKDPDYEDIKPKIIECIGVIWISIENTKFGEVMGAILKRENEALSNIALNTQTQHHEARKTALETLFETDEDIYVETVLNILSNPDPPMLNQAKQFDTPQGKNIVSITIRETFIDLSLENLKKLRNGLHRLLENNEGDQILTDNCSVLLKGIREKLFQEIDPPGREEKGGDSKEQKKGEKYRS